MANSRLSKFLEYVRKTEYKQYYFPIEKFFLLAEEVELPPVLDDKKEKKFSWYEFRKQVLEAVRELKGKSYQEIKRLKKEANKIYPNQLLTPESGNKKLEKTSDLDTVYTVGLFLAPSTSSGIDICPCSTPDCEQICLGKTAGNMRYSNVQQSQKNKTKFMFNHPKEFIYKLAGEIVEYNEKAEAEGKLLAVRLNGTSDIPWETISQELFDLFPDVQFYDYTKIPQRTKKELPLNYHLTLSYTGPARSNWKECRDYLERGGNVAVTFALEKPKSQPLPKWVIDKETGKRYKVEDGDKHDARYLNEPGTIIGLKLKGVSRNNPAAKNFTLFVPYGEDTVEIS